MAENLGAIRYEIDMDTANMLRGEAVIDKSISGIVKDFDRADKAVRDFEESQRKLGRTINAAGQVLDKNGDVLAGLSNEYRRLAFRANKAKDQIDKVSKSSSGAANGFSRLSIVAGAVFNAIALNSVRQMADNMILLENRLKTVTKSNVELMQVQARLFDISQQTNSSLSSTVELYARIARGTKDLKLTQEQTLTVTKALNQAFQLGGASAVEAGASVIQLSQALASGVLRGDEFNSVAEQAPLLLEALADETGRTTGELRGLAEQGRLTADVVLRAIIKASSGWNKEYEKLNKTSAQAFGNLSNATGMLVSNLDKAVGFTAGLVRSMNEVAAVITVIASRAPLMGEGIAAALTPIRSLVALITDGPEAAAKVIEDTISLTKKLASGSELESFINELNQVRGMMGLPVDGAASEISISPKIIMPEKSPIDLAIERFNKNIKDFKLTASEAGTAIGDAFGSIATEGVGRLSDSLAEAVINGESASDTVRNVAKVALTEMLSSLIKIGLQYGINAMMANTATAATTSASVASGAAITAAMAPAAAATSIATAGAAPAAAAGISLSTIAAIVGALTVGAVAGSREFGGPVSAGSMYRVGEKGNPEFFKNKSGQLSMIPGENGEVIPANKLMGGGVNWSVNVENYGPDKAYATIDDVNKTVNVRIGREVAGMRDGTSQFGKAMKASGNYKNRASS